MQVRLPASDVLHLLQVDGKVTDQSRMMHALIALSMDSHAGRHLAKGANVDMGGYTSVSGVPRAQVKACRASTSTWMLHASRRATTGFCSWLPSFIPCAARAIVSHKTCVRLGIRSLSQERLRVSTGMCDAVMLPGVSVLSDESRVDIH